MATKTATAQVSETADKEKGVQLTGTVSADLSEKIETHRWANRMTRAQVLREAVEEWAAQRGL